MMSAAAAYEESRRGKAGARADGSQQVPIERQLHGREGVNLPDKSPAGLYPLHGREQGTECEIVDLHLERPGGNGVPQAASGQIPPRTRGADCHRAVGAVQSQPRGENALPQLPKIPRTNGKAVGPKPRNASGGLYDLTHSPIQPSAVVQI